MLLILGTWSCRETRSRPDDVLVVSKEQTASWVRNFNPLLAPGTSRWPSSGGVYEPLMIFNTVTGEYVPWLATSRRFSDDASTLTLDLRSGVRWSDGEVFDAADVVFTFELIRRHGALDLHGVWRYLSDVSAVSPNQVRFTFERVFVPGQYYIVQQAIVPEHHWKDVEDPVAFANERPVGTGPFTEVTVFRQQIYELGRNPYYWQELGVRALRFPAFPSNDQANLALINDEIDWAGNFVPAIDRIFADKSKHHNYWFPLVGGTVMLYPNHTRAPFDDVRVRKAISMAIDRERLVRVAMYGYTRPADATGLSDRYKTWRGALGTDCGYNDPDSELCSANGSHAADAGVGHEVDTDWVLHRPEVAKRLLREAGQQDLSLTLGTVTGWSDWMRAAQIVARALGEVGIDVQLETYDFAAWFDKLQRGDFDLSMGWTVEGATPYAFYRALMSPATVRPRGEPSAVNWHRFGSRDAEQLLARFERSTDRAEQRQLALGLQRLFADRAPVIPLFLNPSWGTFNDSKFTGFPSAADPVAKLTPNDLPECLLVLTRLRRRQP